MSDETKVEPCAWCGREPIFIGGQANCNTHECLMEGMCCYPETWAKINAKILTQRRKDFEAGFARGMGESFEDYLASK